MKYSTVIISATLVCSISTASYAQEDQQWGNWAISRDPAKTDNTETTSKPPAPFYGSGIAGNDENTLHQLDQSTLLDYTPQLEPAFPPPTNGGNGDHATGPGGFDLEK